MLPPDHSESDVAPESDDDQSIAPQTTVGTEPSPGPTLDAANLPPIEPPSAGFIVQLFVVPALIVAVVIGAYLLFVKGASRQVDWIEMAARLHDNNQTIRLKAANSLAELLNAEDALARSEKPEGADSSGLPASNAAETSTEELPLTRNPQLAQELAKALTHQLDSQSGTAKPMDRNFQEFLIKALGKMDVPEVALPPLRRARQLEDQDLKKYAAIGILQVLEMSHGRGAAIDDPQLVQEILTASEDSTDVLRAIAVNTLAFLPGDASEQRLNSLLSHPDTATRMSAAVALVHFDSTAGLGVFEETLRRDHSILNQTRISSEDEGNEFFERQQQARMAMVGVGRLLSKLTSAERSEFIALIQPYRNVAYVPVKQQAFTTLEQLEAVK
ncbi:MAG: HEAT repeat domain-containing protein [Planctomycetaceae bacterium]